MLDNTAHITDMILSGVTHRHPKLDIVVVESGVGWPPFLLDLLDWNWKGTQAFKEHPDWELTPKEYFRRQCYGCFWAEGDAARAAIELYPDNCLFETDFPHPTSLTPSRVEGVGARARDHISGDLPEDVLKKVLHECFWAESLGTRQAPTLHSARVPSGAPGRDRGPRFIMRCRDRLADEQPRVWGRTT